MKIVDIFWAFLATFFWGVTQILMRSAKPSNQMRLMVWASVIPPLPLLILSIIFEEDQFSAVKNMGWEGFSVLLYTGLCGTIWAFAIWGKLLKKYSVAIVSPFTLLVPVFSMTLATILLGEQFSTIRLVGSLAVFLGLAIIVMWKNLPFIFLWKKVM
ncbi:hypothetical protein AB835_05610 [Candidatus Endobugula sertula]|uniref:EamA domain-containing protein n=1 Tax=Candidatus Endobugula sertula TaxID=62101 RepID=A0A1D2QR03_9GAMM|nr:hypothetical protein AB835_05610 [Candidatus Endobugula sertula]